MDLYRLNTAKFMYKAKTKTLPQTLYHMFLANAAVHEHNTRQRDHPHLMPIRNNQIAKQISQKGAEIWIHHVPPQLKEAKTVKDFGRKLKQYYLI